jgi:hypothetical protein
MSKASDERFQAWREKRAALKELPFTEEEKARWSEMMHETWSAIAADRVECRTSGEIVEVVCNANRMMTFASMTKEEDAFLSVVYSRPSFQLWARKQMNY